METLKILFLDVDGVLTSFRTRCGLGAISGNMKKWDPVACGFLNRLHNVGGVEFVISSDWRRGRTRKHWEELLYYNGINPEALFKGEAWKTAVTYQVRGEEVDLWLKQNPVWDEYVIVDDDSSFYDHQQKHFVKTDGMEGLTSKDFRKICNVLNIDLYSLWNRKLT
jgi:hypothetical protein